MSIPSGVCDIPCLTAPGGRGSLLNKNMRLPFAGTKGLIEAASKVWLNAERDVKTSNAVRMWS
jgi:hypothetical protein